MKYYIVESNDGCPASLKLNTLKAAKKELKDIKKEDRDIGPEDGEIDYYIMEYEETEEKILYRRV